MKLCQSPASPPSGTRKNFPSPFIQIQIIIIIMPNRCFKRRWKRKKWQAHILDQQSHYKVPALDIKSNFYTIHFTTAQCSSCTHPTSMQLSAGQQPQLHKLGTELQLQDRRAAAASKLPPHYTNVLTYPRIRNSSFGVLKCWEQSHCQVMSHVQQFVVIILNGHITKRLFGICNYYVGRKQASQNPIGKGKELQVLNLI